MDERYEEVGGHARRRSRWTVFRRVTLPLVAPSLVAGAVLAWARALGEFGATITFAGNIAGRTQTLPLAVYLLLESNQDAAIALSLVLLAVSLVVLVSLRDRWLAVGRDLSRPSDGRALDVELAGVGRPDRDIGLAIGPSTWRRAHGRSGNGDGDPRTQRRRQDHDPAVPGRAERRRPSDRSAWDRPSSTIRRRTFVPPEAAPGRRRLPGLPVVPPPDRGRQHRLRPAGRRSGPRRCPASEAAGLARALRPVGPCRGSSRGTSRVGRPSGSRSPGRWRRHPTSSSSTSRWPRSTPGPGSRSDVTCAATSPSTAGPRSS